MIKETAAQNHAISHLTNLCKKINGQAGSLCLDSALLHKRRGAQNQHVLKLASKFGTLEDEVEC